MKIQSLLTSNLDNKQINQIISLKNSHWKYSKKSQINWFRNKLQNYDLHNILTKKKLIIGYTLLKKRTLYLTNKKKLNYLNFETLILNKKFRNFIYLAKLMRFNNLIIKKEKKISFLECNKDKINMYKFFGWVLLKKKQIKILDKKSNKNIMIYNYNNKILKKRKFYLYINK